jgi:flavin-dependent dehydrogenase
MLGLGKVSDFIVGAQAEVSTNDLIEIEVYFNQEVAPGFFAWLVPTSPAKALVGLAVRHNPGLYLKKLISSLQAQGKIVSTDAEILYRGIPLKPLTKTCGNRVIVVGDAVGQVKPTTGGGIYYGLLCADIAAGTLHQALERNILSARSLAGYERGWRKKLGQELRLCYWARKFYRRLSDRQIDRIFDIIISNEIDKALLDMDDLSFDWHGEILLRVLKQQTWLKAINAVLKVPFRIGAD